MWWRHVPGKFRSHALDAKRCRPSAQFTAEMGTGRVLVFVVLVLVLPLAHAVVIDLYTDAGCSTPTGNSFAAQPGACFAWSGNGLVVECDPSVGATNVTLFVSSGRTDRTAPVCTGTSVVFTATVTAACAVLPSPFSFYYARVSDPSCSLGGGVSVPGRAVP